MKKRCQPSIISPEVSLNESREIPAPRSEHWTGRISALRFLDGNTDNIYIYILLIIVEK